MNTLEMAPMQEYRNVTKRLLHLTFPHLAEQDLDNAINYSITKRITNEPVKVYNNYKNITVEQTLLELTDYIMKREPIMTMNGVLFKKHADCPNPVTKVVDMFLDNRGIHKKEMFRHPRGSELFERYNLFQILDKRDGNAVYGILGLVTSFFYNLHVSPSITAQGRTLISAAALQFEMFLANNVKFNNLDEVVVFIDHVLSERPERKFADMEILDRPISAEECFSQIIHTCGYFWIPTEEECEIIYDLIIHLGQEDINRLYYKNNLYEFMSNSRMIKMLENILTTLKTPFMSPGEVPEEIKPQLEKFTAIIMEYVYYHWQIPDRVDRMDTMIKSVCLISDTDSAIISTDAWYNFCLKLFDGKDFKMLHVKKPIKEWEENEFGEVLRCPIKFIDNEVDYDFYNANIIEREAYINPIDICSQDNFRYTSINIMSYVLDRVINDYMIRFTKETHSWAPDRKCRIIMKNEFLMRRVLMLMVKKNYASILELQEGERVPKENMRDLAITGIQSIKKSVTPKETRAALTRILYEDILKCDEIDCMKVVRHLAVLEQQITDKIYSGSKDFYKPAKVKSMTSYADPMAIQGIKAMIVWNGIKDDDITGFDLNTSNPVDLAKVIINKNTAEYIKDDYPHIYNKILRFLEEHPKFNNNISCIALPKSVLPPKWLLPLIDVKEVVNDNISGFPIEAIGISRKGNTGVNYTNVIKL